LAYKPGELGEPRGSGMRAGAVIEEAQEAVVCPVQEVRGFAELS
jgi:hypothetical protein